MPCKSSRAGGAPPRTDALIGSAAFGDVQKTDCLKRRASDAPLLFSLDSLELWNSSKLRFPFSRLRPPTRAGPLDAHLGTNHRRGSKTVPSRNGATNSTIAEESFPGDVTQPSQVSTREQPKEPEPPTWPPRTKNWTHAGKRNQKATACFTSTTDSKYNKQSVFILTKLVKFDLNAVTKQRFVRDRFPVS